MSASLSRRKISAYAAQQIANGTKASDVLSEIAAYLIETKRTRDVELVARSVEAALTDYGIVVADVTSAHQLDESLRASIKKLIGGEQVVLREKIEPSMLGGICVDTPGKRLDATVRHRLNTLRAQKVN